ncbi:hypothetical protein DACRYDRAFT_20320 [Dacryopinax primogenitus]|uniref:Extracellular membrane protein CFEM domain-containing protein n=1 Tax=Dacryopinax primogenitus (strain DJM 731) TaxID=1858805 RepID=M5G7F2_DACPD|nr:uncharacterized protein DACRYDRAFT_20320 [Dacryopinax primogenitus]EJU04659.1 hypothetical protein DACRYDRAFT_20320 [Dacryopinax primogenitus]
MHFLSSSILLLALAAVGAQARPQEVAVRGLSGHVDPRNKVRDSLISKRQTEQCTGACSGDTNTLNAMAACASSGSADPIGSGECICQQMALLSSGCETCILNEDQITPADWAQTCAQLSSLPPSVLSTAAGSTSTGSSSVCTSQCSSAGDASGVTALLSCSTEDTACLCSAASGLSSTCLSCVLTYANLTQSQMEQICSSGTIAGGPSGTSTAGNAANTSSNKASNTGGASSPSTSATHSGTAKVAFGIKGAFVACTFVFVGGLMTLF